MLCGIEETRCPAAARWIPLGALALVALVAQGAGAASGDDASSGNFGYVWVNSVNGGSIYDWETGSATIALGASDGWFARSIPAGMEFEYYGDDHSGGDSYWITADGHITLAAPGGNSWAPQSMPNGAAPNGVIAPMWQDYWRSCNFYLNNPGPSGFPRLSEGYVASGAHPRWVISFEGWPTVGNQAVNDRCTDFDEFGLKLFSGTDIGEFHYKAADNWFCNEPSRAGQACNGVRWIKPASIGIEAPAGAKGLQREYNAPGATGSFSKIATAYRWFVNDPANAVSDTWVIDMDSADNPIRISNNDDPVVYHSLTGPDDGTLAGFPTQTVYGVETFVDYTPDAAFYGTDTFGYKVDDGHDAQVAATKTIHVNAPPSGAADTFALDQDDPKAFLDVLDNDDDPFYSTWSGPSGIPELRVLDVGPSTLGTLAISADGKGLDFTPAAGASGQETIWYIVTDGRLTDNVSVSIDVAPLILIEEPVMAKNGTLEMLEGEAVPIGANTLQTTHASFGSAHITYRIVALPGLGALSLDGATLAGGDAFTQEDVDAGRLVFEAAQAGTALLDVEASTPDALTVEGTVTLVVHPLVLPEAGMKVPGGPYYSTLGIRLTDASKENSYPIVSRDWTVLDAQGATVANFTGVVVDFSPPAVGNYTVRLLVTDARGNTDEATAVLAVPLPYSAARPYFIVSDSRPDPGQAVKFTDASEKGSYELVAREWIFEDGDVPKVAAIVDHVFASPGHHKVTLRIVDKGGSEYFHTETIVVGEVAVAGSGETTDLLAGIETRDNIPRADAGPDQVVLQGSVVQLAGTASHATAPGPLQYTWSHVSGVALPMAGADTATPRVSVPYLGVPEGEAILALVVTDSEGRVSLPDRVRLVLRDGGEPSLDAIAPPGADFSFELSPTGEVFFRARDAAGPGVVYTWDFGDGTTQRTSDPELRHRFTATGVHQVRLRVEDAFGRVAEHQRAVVVQDASQSAADGGDGPVELDSARPPVHAKGGGWALGLLAVVVVVSLAAVGGTVWLFLRRRGTS